MKLLATVVIFLSITGCGGGKKIAVTKAGYASYRVYKIDSLNNWYIIFAKSDKNYCKILSKKNDDNIDLDKIENKRNYLLELQSFSQLNYSQHIISSNVDCFSLDSITKICKEPPRFKDLYFTTSLSGLRLVKIR